MRVLFISGELIAGDLSLRLKEEGCEVKLFIEHPRQKRCLDGFVEKTDDWKKELTWVGKDGLIVFDDVGYGKIQDNLRKEGYRVVGGSEGGDKLEQNREYGQQVMAECGITIVPNYNFTTADVAIAYVLEHKGTWVVKQNDHQSTLNYVGTMLDGGDVVSVLENYKKIGIKNISLQRKLNGIEVAVGRFFNGTDWVGPPEVNIEHKSFFNDNIGPKTGEMGTIMWYVNEENRLFQETLNKLKPHLQDIGFRGILDINCFVNKKKVFPIEVTARFGCPITHLQTSIIRSPWKDHLVAVADGKDYNLKVNSDYGLVLTLAVPPFPYGEQIKGDFTLAGMEIFLPKNLKKSEKKRIHFEGVSLQKDQNMSHYVLTENIGYAAFISGFGKTVQDARKKVYLLVERLVVPKVMYRTDIGLSFINKDENLLTRWGWL